VRSGGTGTAPSGGTRPRFLDETWFEITTRQSIRGGTVNGVKVLVKQASR
jgi:hypothetical protein